MDAKRKPSDKLTTYLLTVKEREKNLPTISRCFTNDFDKSIQFKHELLEIFPDLDKLLLVTELDALVDLVYDKTCEDLRSKKLLSEESKQVLGR